MLERGEACGRAVVVLVHPQPEEGHRVSCVPDHNPDNRWVSGSPRGQIQTRKSAPVGRRTADVMLNLAIASLFGVGRYWVVEVEMNPEHGARRGVASG